MPIIHSLRDQTPSQTPCVSFVKPFDHLSFCPRPIEQKLREELKQTAEKLRGSEQAPLGEESEEGGSLVRM